MVYYTHASSTRGGHRNQPHGVHYAKVGADVEEAQSRRMFVLSRLFKVETAEAFGLKYWTQFFVIRLTCGFQVETYWLDGSS